MASKLWVFLVFSLIGSTITAYLETTECPIDCRCSCDGKVVDCSGLKWTYVSKSLTFPPQMEKLNLSNNQINEFPVFPQKYFLPQLKEVVLDSNQIGYIESNSFHDLDSIESLSFVNNLIKFIEKDAFAGLSNLVHLNLRQNRLKSLYDGMFVYLSSLQTVDLRDNPWTYGRGCEWIRCSDCCPTDHTSCNGDGGSEQCYLQSEMTELGFSSMSDEPFVWTDDGSPIKLWSFLSREQDGFFQVLNETVLNETSYLEVDAGGTLDSDANYFRVYQVPSGLNSHTCDYASGTSHSVMIMLGVPGGQLNRDDNKIYMLCELDSTNLVARPSNWNPSTPTVAPTFWSGFSLTEDLPDLTFCVHYIQGTSTSQFWMTNVKMLPVTNIGYEPYRYLSTNSNGVISGTKVFNTEMYRGSSNPSLIYTAIFYPNSVL